MPRSAARSPREPVTVCGMCGEPLPNRAGGRRYCGYDCSLAAEKARRPSLPKTDYTVALRADPCAYCGKRVKSTCLDHIDPLSKGGLNDELNLTASCRSCNASKNDDKLLAFLLWHSA
jgi:5-methylcytosine-specific restriction endonuclease McrA